MAQEAVGSSPITHPSFSGYSVVRLTRLLWEQEIGSSNLSTPTLEKYQTSLNKALSSDGALCFHSLSYLSIVYQIKDTFKRNSLTQRNSLPSTQNAGGWGAYVRGTHIVQQFFQCVSNHFKLYEQVVIFIKCGV